MAEWSTQILRRLRDVPGFPGAVGLTDGMTGPEFEERLGAFLRSVVAFRSIRPLLEPLGQMLRCNAPLMQGGGNQTASWEVWHEQALFQLDQVVGRIYEAMYECFAAPNYDPGHVHNAYASLLTHLGIDRDSKWVYATTNYDVIADIALESLGLTFDDGTHSSRFAGSGAERQFRVGRLLSVVDRDVPLLHLHGRVGWMVREGPGRPGPYAVDGMASWQSSFGVPLVMLPDPHKDPEQDAVLGEMWIEFHHALRRAKRVLVLGHSLHDERLVDALSEPSAAGKLAVTLLGDPNTGELQADAPQVAEMLSQRLPNACQVALRFGRDYGPEPPVQLNQWLDATAQP